MHDLDLDEEIAAIMQDAQWLEALYNGTTAELRAISQLEGLPSGARVVSGEEPFAPAEHHQHHPPQPSYRTKSKRQQPRPPASSSDDTAPATDGATAHRSYERGLEQLRAKAAKEEKLRARLQLEQEAGATFQPKTTAKAQALTRGVEDMMAWEESRKSKQAVRRKQRLEDEQNAQLAAPRLNARSRGLLQQRQAHRPSSNGSTTARSAGVKLQSSTHRTNLNNRSVSVPAGARQRDRISSTRSRSSSSSSPRMPSKSPARSRSTERPIRHSAEAATAPASRQYRRQSAAQLDHDILQFEEGVVLRQLESRTATRRIRLSELERRNVQPYATSSKRSSTPHHASASAADPAQSFDDQLWLQYRMARDTPASRTPAARLASRTQRDTTSLYTSPPYEDGIAESQLNCTNQSASTHIPN